MMIVGFQSCNEAGKRGGLAAGGAVTNRRPDGDGRVAASACSNM